MNAIKAEVEEEKDWQLNDDYLNFENRCLICLQVVTQASQEKSLNFLFNYLKIRHKVKLDVCETCEENVAKFKKLCETLEKVRLEMDYLLDSIKSSISNSNQDFISASLEIASVREAVMKKCGEQIKFAKPQINLQRLDLSNIKTRSRTPTFDCSEDFSQQFDAVDDSNSSLSDTSAAPVIDEIKSIKMEINSGDQFYSANGKKCLKCSKTFTRRKDLQRHVEAVHLRLKPINCSECPKTFSFSKDLSRHIKYVHLQHKPFKCDICDKSFSTKHNE